MPKRCCEDPTHLVFPLFFYVCRRLLSWLNPSDLWCDHVTMDRMTKYLDFIEKRATGELLTPAAVMDTEICQKPRRLQI